MKNKIEENQKMYVNKKMARDPEIETTSQKYHKDLFIVPDDKYNQMMKQGVDSSDTSVSSTQTGGVYETEVDGVIGPQDPETIKYLSNVKDPNTGELSKPFVIGDKNYQMVRGIKPNREIVLAVLSLDELTEGGTHKIYDVDHFDKTVATPMKECGMGQMQPMQEEAEPNHDKEKFIDHLNLNDVNGYKHFFVEAKTGNITNKFKTTDEMLKSGIALRPNERYMNIKQLKHNRYENYFKPTMNEADEEVDGVQGTDMKKLKTDVETLTNMISTKFATAISKLDKKVEKIEFLKYMAEMIGVPFNKLNSLINSYQDMATQQKAPEPAPVMEDKKVISKDALLESLGVKQTITKVKDIK